MHAKYLEAQSEFVFAGLAKASPFQSSDGESARARTSPASAVQRVVGLKTVEPDWDDFAMFPHSNLAGDENGLVASTTNITS